MTISPRLTIQVARAARLKRANAEVEERNARRGAWAATLQGVQGTLQGAGQSRLVQGTVASRPAAFVARKIRAARERRRARRSLRETDAAFSSAALEGGTPDEASRDAAALDDFDRKLEALEAATAASTPAPATSTTTVAAGSARVSAESASEEEEEAAAAAAKAAWLAKQDVPSWGPQGGGGEEEPRD